MIKIIFAKLVFVLIIVNFSPLERLNKLIVDNKSQQASDGEVDESLSNDLRIHLLDRINQFSEYQKVENWEKVDEFLGDYFFGFGWERSKYTKQQKQWMMKRLQSKKLISFTPEKIHYISSNNGLPLNKRYWMITGKISYLEDEKVIVNDIGLIAYLHNDEFYFTPLEVSNIGMDLVIPPLDQK
jgi:hypothetical protein